MVTVNINGSEHVLKLGVSACRKVEERLGKSIFEALGAKPDGSASLPTIGNLSVLFWGALLFERKDITQQEADDLLDGFLEDPEHDLGSVVELIQKALNFTKAEPIQEHPIQRIL